MAAPVIKHRKLVLIAAMLASFMAAVESTIVGTAMPTIVADLGHFNLFSWVFAAYLLTQAVTVPIYGRLADLYGRKRMFYIGAGVFLLGSTLCGLAPSMGWLIAFRAIQGIGAGAIQPIAYTIVGDIYSAEERARVQGFLSGVFGVAAVVGPSVGAFLVSGGHWPIVFWINIPIGFAAMAMLGAFYREPLTHKVHQIDYLGGGLLVVGGGALMIALVQAASLPHGVIAGCVIVGLLSIGVLVRHELHVMEPIIPIHLWRNPTILLTHGGSFGIGMVTISVTAFLPTYVQGVIGGSAGEAGVVLGATSISWAIAGFAAGFVMTRFSFRVTAVLGAAVLISGEAFLIAMTAGHGALFAVVGASLIGFGLGLCSTTYVVAVQGAVSAQERGAATSSFMFARLVGQSLGAALFGAVVNITLGNAIPASTRIVDQLMDPLQRHNLDGHRLLQVVSTMNEAIRYVYIASAMFAAVMLLIGTRLYKNKA